MNQMLQYVDAEGNNIIETHHDKTLILFKRLKRDEVCYEE